MCVTEGGDNNFGSVGIEWSFVPSTQQV